VAALVVVDTVVVDMVVADKVVVAWVVVPLASVLPCPLLRQL